MESGQPSTTDTGQRTYSPAQRDYIRARLRIYFMAEKSAAVYAFSWSVLADRIFEYTKVRLKGESIRQFAEGQMSRGKPRGTKNYEALVTFLSHPLIQALSLEELEEVDAFPERPLAFELIQYLSHGKTSEIIPPPQFLEGIYRAIDRSLDEEITRIELILKLTPDGQAIQIVERAESYDKSLQHGIYRWPEREPKERPDIKKESHGFAILTPEDNILAFMKGNAFPANHYYLTMGISPDFWSAGTRELFMLRQDYPVELREGDDLHEQQMDIEIQTSRKILWFYKKTRFPVPS